MVWTTNLAILNDVQTVDLLNQAVLKPPIVSAHTIMSLYVVPFDDSFREQEVFIKYTFTLDRLVAL